MFETYVNVGRFRLRVIRGEGEGNPVIFLHGYIFTSDVWKDVTVLHALEYRNIPFLAIDMPYGQKSLCEPKSSDLKDNLNVLYKLVKGEPIMVGASLGGYIAAEYSIRRPVKGLLLIAPVRCLEIADMIKAKVRIIYGKRDLVVSIDEMKRLADLTGGELIVYEKATHPAYLDEPERFKRDLLEFVELLS